MVAILTAPMPVPPVAVLALDLAHRCDLDHRPVLRAARDPDRHEGSALFPISMAIAHVRGLLDARPGDLELVVALGILCAAMGDLIHADAA